MKIALSPHERYLVVRAKGGWSVNLGADALQVYPSRDDAREAAARHAESAVACGRSADWVDTADDTPNPTDLA
jgi:hypothetical protein